MSGPSAISPEQFTSFGELLRHLRRRADLSERDLALAVGYSEAQISRLEHNRRAPDASVVAARFVPALDIERDTAWATRLLELARAAPPTVAGNLPLPLTSFVGRAAEVAEIHRLLTSDSPLPNAPRLLTLTGAGGVGKTRLALEAAAGLADAFPDGVWLVELASLAEASHVPQTLATVLGLRLEGGRSPLATLARHLRSKRALIVLDNCEHLLDACAHLVEALLKACPDLRTLATSRERLSIAGEWVRDVPSLSTPDPGVPLPVEAILGYDAVRLFVERASAVAPTFHLTADHTHAVAEVCHRLDGIPLALELAAARLPLLPIEQLAARLDNRFAVLTDGSRTALPRHQTLRGVMDWSYDLLESDEQALFRRLGVFVGGWTLEAAEAAAGDGIETDDVLTLLGRLVDKSLVRVETQEGVARYRMLETVREYALGRLAASGEEDAMRRRHAEYYVGLVEAAGTHEGRRGLGPVAARVARVRMNIDNVRAATRWSQSTMDGRDLEMRLVPPLLRMANSDVWDDAIAWLETALAHAREIGTPSLVGWVLQGLGFHLTLQGEYAAAQARLVESLMFWREDGNVWHRAYVLERLGWLARERGDAATARVWLEQSLPLYREADDLGGLAGALNTLGEVAVMQEDPARAISLLEEALRLNQARGHRPEMGWTLNHLGHVAQLEGDYERARRLYEESAAFFRGTFAAQAGLAWDSYGLGEAALGYGDARLARTRFIEALGYLHSFTDHACMLWCLAGLAGVASLEGQSQRAARLWGAAERLRASMGARPAPASRATRERLMAMARQQLGDAAFEAAWAAGQTLTLEEALAEAQEGGGD